VNIGEMVKEYFSSKNKKEEECVCFSIEMEMDESRSCIEPVLLAEQDRIVLRQYRANRDEETKLMSDVPDWKVGTWFGEKVFKSRTYFPDRPHVLDYYGLARPSTQRLDINASQWQI
jgi:NADH dehydrogenase (ubiquinone) 1 alpha subcomplex subunit 13